VIPQQDNKYAAEFADVITKPPPPPPSCYDRIKAELISRLSLSEEQRVRQFLMHKEMGDRRPTQFLHNLRTLPCPSVPSDFHSNMWTNHLSPNIQVIIDTQGQTALDDVAQLVDKTAEVTPPSVAGASSPGDISILT
jgi:hypothetical protein